MRSIETSGARRVPFLALSLVGLTCLWTQAGCTAASPPAAAASDSAAGSDANAPDSAASADSTAVDTGTVADASSADAAVIPAPKPAASQAQKEFEQKYAPVLKKSSAMTLAEFLAVHTPKDLPVAAKPPYDANKAKYADLITQKLALTPAETQKLADVGFVVSDRLQRPTMATALLEVYQKDLPVLVTTDLILQALHASYDDILKSLEQHLLAPTMTEVLKKTHVALATVAAGPDGQAGVARDDADFYLTVARSLLAGVAQKANKPELDKQVAEFLGYVHAEQMREVVVFGTKRTMDFSQFKPRGHYAGIPELEHYFRALMWLGRVDLRFAESDMGKGWKYQPRQVMAAVLLLQATQQGAAMPGWQTVDDLVMLMVGPVDYIDFRGVEALATDRGWKVASDVGKMAQPEIDAMLSDLVAGKYGSQKIASHYLATNPYSAEPTPLAPSFAFLGQRFVVDSFVFSNVVYDRVIHDGKKVQRVLPNPLDALFVLGNSQVLPLLQPDFAAHPYWGALHTLRYLVDSYEPAFWQSNVYNLWLDSLRQLNVPTTAAKYPFAMRTPQWRDKTAATQLASWAQLRHDTLLYAKQSYTGGVACEHPAAYVEPYPAFFQRLGLLAKLAGQSLANANGGDAQMKGYLAKFFANWQVHMGKLEAIAQHELDGADLTGDELKYLKTIIMADPGCGAPVFSGWYASLWFQTDNLDKFKPTIADVHTNPNAGPLPGPNVLHVATGNVSLMVMTVDHCAGAAAYVGPVFRYHEVDVKEIKRLNDQEWEKMLQDGTAPDLPKWTESYRVKVAK